MTRGEEPFKIFEKEVAFPLLEVSNHKKYVSSLNLHCKNQKDVCKVLPGSLIIKL
jgi:hypothetical protein